MEELGASLKDCTAKRLYVSALPYFSQFRRYVDNVVWETEVWVGEIPDLLIHLNGEEFLGTQEQFH